MRRSLWSRVLAGWLACWLPLVLADAGWLHACPMHAAGMTTMAMSAPATASPMAETPSAAGAHHSGHHGGHACTCAGACCTPLAVVASAPSAIVPVASSARLVVAGAAQSEGEYVAAWVDFVLPFATAPPRTRAIA